MRVLEGMLPDEREKYTVVLFAIFPSKYESEVGSCRSHVGVKKLIEMTALTLLSHLINTNIHLPPYTELCDQKEKNLFV